MALSEDEATLALRLVTLTILGLSLAWWFVDGGFEPVITGVAAIAGLVSAGLVSAARQERREKASAAAPPAPRVDLEASPLSFGATPHTVGRQDVVDALLGELDALRENHRGKLVCVTGEAGIGKTTVAENFLSELSPEAVTIARGRCSQRLAGAEAYLPLLESLESLLRGTNGSTVGELMIRAAPSWYRQLESQYVSAIEPGSSGAFSQERLKRELVLFYEQLSRDRPFVLFLEDLHWADVSTVDMLTYVADRFDRARALVLVTYRPDDMRLSNHAFLQVRPTLEHRGMLRELPLPFLRLEDVQDFLSLEFSGQSFPVGLAELIHAKTEGSPLFIVELVRDLRRRGVLSEREGRWTLTESLEAISGESPESIRSMIARKIEQLDHTERRILLAASVQGEEFDAAVIAGALDTDVLELEESLERIERDHAFATSVREQEFPDGTVTLRYRFVHVLYQNTLYASLAPARRVSLSLGVAQALERLYPDETSPVAAALALLYETAREPERATGFFLQAAQNANRVFAHHEVATLARRGIAVLESMPETPERARTELALRTTLAPALMAVSGWAAPEADENNRRAEALCREVGDDREIFAMLSGLLAVLLVRGYPEKAHAVWEEHHELAARLNDPILLLHAHYAVGDILTLRGELVSARRHQKAALRIWHSEERNSLPLFFAQHPASSSLAMESWVLVMLGYPDQALNQAREAVDLAGSLSHPFSSEFAMERLGGVLEFRGELLPARKVASDQIELAEEHGFAFWRSTGLMTQGRVLARSGSAESGLAKMQEALAMLDAAGAKVWRTRDVGWIAEALAQTGRVSEGLELIEQGLAFVADRGQRLFHAELLRARGDMFRLAGYDSTRAESCYRSALDVSQSQEARAAELRAAVSLSRLLRDEGRRAEARDLLEPIYEWFTEGFETVDLREAQHLIEELSG